MQGRGKVLAFDKDGKRLQRLVANAERTATSHVITAQQADFLTLDPGSEEFAEVGELR